MEIPAITRPYSILRAPWTLRSVKANHYERQLLPLRIWVGSGLWRPLIFNGDSHIQTSPSRKCYTARRQQRKSARGPIGHGRQVISATIVPVISMGRYPPRGSMIRHATQQCRHHGETKQWVYAKSARRDKGSNNITQQPSHQGTTSPS